MESVSDHTRCQTSRSMSGYRRESSDPITEFCTMNNLGDALSILSEELESLNLLTIPIDIDQTTSVESWTLACLRLSNACWGLVHKYRSLMKASDQASDIQHKTVSDNSSLVNHVKRLKDDLERKGHQLSESEERERRLNVKCDSLARDFKREKDEATKLRKQILSKDVQHAHEIKRLDQSNHKIRQQLQRCIGMYVPRDKVSQNIQSEHERQLNMYKQTICRLEDNNRQLLTENNDLREALSLHSDAINLQAEASGIWNDADV